MYIFWLEKPHNVHERIYLERTSEETEGNNEQILEINGAVLANISVEGRHTD